MHAPATHLLPEHIEFKVGPPRCLRRTRRLAQQRRLAHCGRGAAAAARRA